MNGDLIVSCKHEPSQKMMRRKRSTEATEEKLKLDISSLIDVCFLLLIYFIVTQTITTPESDLKLELPDGTRAPSEVDAMFFYVADDGSIDQVQGGARETLVGAGEPNCNHRDTEHSDMVQLNATVALYAATAEDKAVIKVKAEPETKAQYVVDLMNMLSHHGVTKITFTEIVN